MMTEAARAATASPRLAIIMPTYRFDETARQALRLAADAGDEDIRVHIGDNSTNPQKHAFLRDLAARSTNVVVTCHPENIGAVANWLFLVEAQNTEFICLAADDDAFTGSYFRAGLRLMSEDGTCSAASGLHVGVAPTVGVPDLYTPEQRLEPRPLARIERYHGQNPMAYAVVRTSVIKGFAEYLRANPIFASFSDYLLTFHLLSIGTYRMDYESYGFIYNNANWSPAERFFETAGRFYEMAGLPAGFGYFARLHWAVVNLHFFRSRFRHPGLTEEDASEIAYYLFQRLKKEAERDIGLQRTPIDALIGLYPAVAAPLTELLERDFDDEASIFERFARFVKAFAPDLASRYHAFLMDTLVGSPMILQLKQKQPPWYAPWRRT